MKYIVQHASFILDFLAAPVSFKDVSKNLPLQDIPMAFHAEYMRWNEEFLNPIPPEAYETLDECFFQRWTDIYVKHFQNKESPVCPIEYFASSETTERQKYELVLEEYWTSMIREAGVDEEDVSATRITNNKVRSTVIKAMPAKLMALKHGLMELLYPDRLMRFYPVPNKIFMYVLGEQLKSIEGAITEVSVKQSIASETCLPTTHHNQLTMWIEPLASLGIDRVPSMWHDQFRTLDNFVSIKFGATNINQVSSTVWRQITHTVLTDRQIHSYLLSHRRSTLLAMNNYSKLALQQVNIDSDSLKDPEFRKTVGSFIKDSRDVLLRGHHVSNIVIKLPTMAPMPSRENLSADQAAFLEVVESAFRRTAYPWLDVNNIKKSETVMKKLSVLYKSDRAREALLATKSAWQVRTFLKGQLDAWSKKADLEEWSWPDEINKKPTRDSENPALDMLEGPLLIDKKESIGNTNARLTAYVDLHTKNHRKMQRIAQLALSEGLGLGSSNKAIPEVRESLEALLAVDITSHSKHTHADHSTDPQKIL